MFPADFPDILHISILEKKWEYRGEGNANLVLALPEERVILRLHKNRRDEPVTEEIEYEEMNRVCREAFFCHTIMVPLLGKAYIQPPRVARVQHKEIHRLDHLLLPQRPHFRHHKGIRFGYVNIYPDYALLPERLTQCISLVNPHALRTTDVVTISRGKCARIGTLSLAHDQSMEDTTRLPTTVTNVLRQKCVNKNCFLSNPESLNSDLCQVPSTNWKTTKSSLQSTVNTGNPTFCVEIKPKQGWIPCNEQHHHPKCTFCLNQYLKLYNGAISQISHYCPLDLFSGDEKRMKKAIRALLRTPQNNLKIFKDGTLVYSDDSGQDLAVVLREWLEPSAACPTELTRLTDSFAGLVYHALTSNLLGDVEYPSLDDNFYPMICSTQSCLSIENSLLEKLEVCDVSSRQLPHNCILDRILWIQKLQQYDAASIHHMLWKYRDCNDYEYVNRLCDVDTNRLCLDPVQRYLLATTAKDCSVLIAFQRLHDSQSVTPDCIAVDNSGAQFVFNIGVSDLDPKPLSCVEKHQKRDSEIQLAVSQLVPDS